MNQWRHIYAETINRQLCMFRYIYIFYGYLKNIELRRNQTLTNNVAGEIEYRRNSKIMKFIHYLPPSQYLDNRIWRKQDWLHSLFFFLTHQYTFIVQLFEVNSSLKNPLIKSIGWNQYKDPFKARTLECTSVLGMLTCWYCKMVLSYVSL